MKGIVAIFLIYLFCTPIFGQDILYPSKQVFIGNNTHTSRDILNNALVDSEQNIYLVGNVENDFTYNDIQLIKLNQNLGVIWEKSISFETNFSYDRVLDSYINEMDELIIVCKSAYNKYSETPVVIKVDRNGELLWQMAFENLSDPKGMSGRTVFSTMDTDGNLTIGLRLNEENQENSFILHKISPNGQITTQNSVDDLYASQKFPITPISSDGTFHYAITRVYNAINDPTLEYGLIRFNNDESISQQIELDELNRNLISEYSEIILDNNDLPIWIDYPSQYFNGTNHVGFIVHYFDSDGMVTNFIKSDTDIRRYVMGRGFDTNNNLIIISESVSQETLETSGILMEKYAPDGSLVDQVLYNESLSGYRALIMENQIAIQLEDKSINLYNTDFEFIKKISLNTGGAINHIPLKIFNVNGNTFVAAQREASLYEDSDFLGQRDFNLQKISPFGEIKDFTFSGSGTSKTWINWIQKNENDDYIVHITDKLGPDNLNIGGSRSKEYSYNYIYGSDLIQKSVFENVSRVSWQHAPTDQVEAFGLNGSQYQYIYNSGSKTFILEKNGEILWSNQWKEDGSPYLYDFKVNSKGSLILRNSFNKIIKLSLEGNFSHIQYPSGQINVLKVLDNDWIFTHADKAMLVFSPDLELISEKESYNGNTYDHRYYTPSFQVGSRILFSRGSILSTDYNMHEMHIYDQYGNLENIYNFHGNLRERYAFLDGNDLVVLTTDGAHIDHGFSWDVAVINKYENFVGNVLKDNSQEDDDDDGVQNLYDYCENTPKGNPVNEHGCNLYDIDNLNFAIKTVGETCFNKKDGQVIITADQALHYNAVLVSDENGIINQNFDNEILFDGLTGGNYEVCITADEIFGFERCFDIYVRPVEQLYVESELSDKNNSVTLNLKGGSVYIIQVNDETFATSSSSIDIPLKSHFNKITVKTAKDCQGIFEEVLIQSYKSSAYPNPTRDGIFQLFLGNNASKQIAYQIFSQDGRLMQKSIVVPENGIIKGDISDLFNGIYFYVLELKGNKVPYRIIKQ